VSADAFGKSLKSIFGPRKRLSVAPIFPATTTSLLAGNTKRRPYGYAIPSGEVWQEKLDQHLEIDRKP
jgi:hypothetical protein